MSKLLVLVWLAAEVQVHRRQEKDLALVKNSSVAGAFFVLELFGYGRQLANANGDAVIPVLLGVAFFYLLLTVPLGILASTVERKVAIVR